MSEEAYRAVVNDQEQYSVWPAEKKLPGGWRDAGFSGKRSECLEFIAKTWTDMRPVSVRAGRAPNAPAPEAAAPKAATPKAPPAKKTTAKKKAATKTPPKKTTPRKKTAAKKSPAASAKKTTGKKKKK